MSLTVVVAVAIGTAVGTHPLPLSLIAAAGLHPPLAAVGAGVVFGLGSHHRSTDVSPAVGGLMSIASEVEGGSSLRQALATVEGDEWSHVRRLAIAGRPFTEMGEPVSAALGPGGAMAGLAMVLAERVGDLSSAVFRELAGQAMDDDEVRREAKAAMAPALLQGGLVGGIPLGLVVARLLDGSLVDLLGRGPLHAVFVSTGIAALVVGSAAVALLVRRSVRGLP